MTFTLMLIFNIMLDVAILAGLVSVMSRAAKLTPHEPSVSVASMPNMRLTRQHPRARSERASSRRLHTVLD